MREQEIKKQNTCNYILYTQCLVNKCLNIMTTKMKLYAYGDDVNNNVAKQVCNELWISSVTTAKFTVWHIHTMLCVHLAFY